MVKIKNRLKLAILPMMIIASAFVTACGAGEDLNEDITCEQIARIHQHCLNTIDDKETWGEAFVELIKGQCEDPQKANLSYDCKTCITTKTCNIADAVTPIDQCIEDETCRDFVTTEE